MQYFERIDQSKIKHIKIHHLERFAKRLKYKRKFDRYEKCEKEIRELNYERRLRRRLNENSQGPENEESDEDSEM